MNKVGMWTYSEVTDQERSTLTQAVRLLVDKWEAEKAEYDEGSYSEKNISKRIEEAWNLYYNL